MVAADRRSAILVSLAYLAIGVVAWWLVPVKFQEQTHAVAAGNSMLALWCASALLVVLALLARDRIGAWMLLAVVGPLALQPLTLLDGSGGGILLAVLWPLSALPLGLALADRRPERASTVASAVAAMVLGFALVGGGRVDPAVVGMLRYVAVIAIAAIPAAIRFARPASDLSAGWINQQAWIVVAAVAPALAGLGLMTSWDVGIAVMVTALVAVAIGSWIAVRPLTWLASRAAVQRDLMFAAGEAERSRLAADLHDGPLQDVLLLARRLEDAGDPEGAALAREIGRELRELSGDLRLPLLDDLGVGPAIEWLAGRVRRMTAAEVEVEIASEGRVPAPVELAAFRIAQEAIANAIRHGSSPIRVRCRTAIDALTLSVEDAGTGRNLDRELETSGAGRMGMLNMQQRADQVGARLEWSHPDRGGTLVALEWHAG
jgi:signal transduction histidine kinase